MFDQPRYLENDVNAAQEQQEKILHYGQPLGIHLDIMADVTAPENWSITQLDRLLLEGTDWHLYQVDQLRANKIMSSTMVNLDDNVFQVDHAL